MANLLYTSTLCTYEHYVHILDISAYVCTIFLDVYILNYCYHNNAHACGIFKFSTQGGRTIKRHFKMRTLDHSLCRNYFQLESLTFICRLLIENGALYFLFSILCFSFELAVGRGELYHLICTL